MTSTTPVFTRVVMFFWLLTFAACRAPDQDIVRHLVIAELMQRERVPESDIAIVSIRFPAADTATVEADILQLPSKSADPARKLVCGLQKKSGRWSVESVRQRLN